MNTQDKRSWVIVGVLFTTMFLIWGPVNAGGVFFLAVITAFRMVARIVLDAGR